jgi:tRNA-dihydrouridine synthase C
LAGNAMSLLLAPMEGLLDFVLRDILTRVGGVERCVSEFIRVTNTLLPERVFYRVVPELHQGGRTAAGVPVRPQLLGSDPACLADNAARVASLGPWGVDLNFGCPAKVVNRHGGGSALLQDPEGLYAIVRAVRSAVPAGYTVSAKMRLGFADASLAVACAQALADGGADELVVHARTKVDGYRPPAYWELLPAVREAVGVSVVANGEIWSVADAQRCRALSGCHSLMLGRGMVAYPALAQAIRAADRDAADKGGDGGHDGVVNSAGALGRLSEAGASTAVRCDNWPALLPHIEGFWQVVSAHFDRRQRAGRLKQWLNLLRRQYPEAETAFQALRALEHPDEIDRWLMGVVGSARAV